MKKMKPESLMMSYGYKPELSEGAIKCPIFQTSTFVFRSAEEGKAFFEVAYGLREKRDDEEMGLIYSRINNPDLEVLENRLCLWDEAEECAVFESGMAAISTAFLAFLNPGDLLLFSNPVYGGTDHFIRFVLPRFGVNVLAFNPSDSKEEIIKMVEASGKAEKMKMLYLETPANPNNKLTDIGMCREIADYFSGDERVILVTDNTYMGPVWQHPIKHGSDLVLYSATKYIGGHSDLIAGACLGSAHLMKIIKEYRTFLGNMAAPHTGWLLMRSLETLKVRMDEQARNAVEVAAFLNNHPKVEKIYYLGYPANERQRAIIEKQCLSFGAMISFDIKGGEKEAFKFINALRLIKLAVSLGGTESLAEHPATMTHIGIAPEDKVRFNISEKLVRLSIGVENHEDLIADIAQALDKV